MGDRAVTGFAEREGAPVIYLYSHWGGSSQIADLQEALRAAESRWSDPDYATRICVSHLVGDDWRSETGYGLSVGGYASPDLPYTLVVNWDSKEVEIRADAGDMERLGAIPFDVFMGIVDENLTFALV